MEAGQLEHHLEREEAGEHEVDVLVDHLVRVRHVVVVAREDDRVEQDEAEHEPIEPRVGDQLVDAVHSPLEALAPAEQRLLRLLRVPAEPLLQPARRSRPTPALLGARRLRQQELLLLLGLLLGLRRG